MGVNVGNKFGHFTLRPFYRGYPSTDSKENWNLKFEIASEKGKKPDSTGSKLLFKLTNPYFSFFYT